MSNKLESLAYIVLMTFTVFCAIGLVGFFNKPKYITISPEFQEQECIATLFSGEDAQIICVISANNFKELINIRS